MNEWNALLENTHLDVIAINGVYYRPGDQVRLCPHGGADIFDLVLSGRIATIEAIEQDFENRIHFAVVIDDDPGKEWGLMRQPGHRFFFAPNEVEPL